MALQGRWINRLVEQAGFPKRCAWGYLALRLMDRANASIYSWLILHVIKLGGGQECVLDVGCGGGRFMAKLVQRTWGRVAGVDPSCAAVERSRRVNRFGIALGREVVEMGYVEMLPFEDSQFDLVTAVECSYFWSSFQLGLVEIQRVLRPGGRVYICNSATETHGEEGLRSSFLVPIHTPRQLEDLLQEVGFEKIERHRHPRDPQLVCVEASKRES